MAKKSTSAAQTPLRKLSWYLLQQALYAAHDEFDNAATKKSGEQKIRAIWQEYARRGMKNAIGPAHVAQLGLRID